MALSADLAAVVCQMFPLFVVRFFVRAAAGTVPRSGFFTPVARVGSLGKAGFDPVRTFGHAGWIDQLRSSGRTSHALLKNEIDVSVGPF